MRTAFGSELDAKVRQRLGKEHLGWHFASRLMTESSVFVSQTLERDLNKVLGDYVDLETVRIRYHHFQTWPDDAERHFLYEVMTLLLWLHRTTP